MILSFITIRKVPWDLLKTSGFALGFQHLPRDLANVNEWKIMFDPYNEYFTFQQCFGAYFQDHFMTVDVFQRSCEIVQKGINVVKERIIVSEFQIR